MNKKHLDIVTDNLIEEFHLMGTDSVVQFEFLGSGSFGAVYKHYKFPYAVKLYSDSGYVRFLDLISKYPKNPFFPKIYRNFNIDLSFGEGPKKNKKIGIAIMEILEPLPHNADNMNDIFWSNLLDIYQEMKSKKILAKMYSQSIHPHTLEVLDVLNTLKRKYKMCLDMHGGNVMMRGGQLVITDPVCN